MTTTEVVYDVRLLSSRIADSISSKSFQTELISWFAGLAVLLACVGLYGLLAFIVGRRTREIGIRIALGASPASVLKTVIGRGFALVVPGLTLGLLGAWAEGRYLQNQLHGVFATDPLTYTVGALSLLVSAFLACWLTARRTSRIDPTGTLRQE